MNIHQNLRQLRQMTGLTQQQAAEQVGITRQALSGYESGRRQPDLEMLERLADLYHTDLMAILYGSTRQQKLARQIKTTSLLLFGLLVGTTLLRCGLTLAINQLLPPASLSPDAIRNLRFPLLSFCSALGGLAQAMSLVGCVILGVLLFKASRLPSPLTWALYGAVLWGCLLLCALIPALLDPLYQPADYLLPLLNVFAPFVLLLLFLIIFWLHQNKRKQ